MQNKKTTFPIKFKLVKEPTLDHLRQTDPCAEKVNPINSGNHGCQLHRCSEGMWFAYFYHLLKFKKLCITYLQDGSCDLNEKGIILGAFPTVIQNPLHYIPVTQKG